MNLPKNEPPLYTLLMEVMGWMLDRTADISQNARFTFCQRVDNLTLDTPPNAHDASRAAPPMLR